MKAVPLRAVPLHRVPPSLLFHGDQIYHRLVYLWVTLILANAGQTAISNLETTGWSSLIDIPKWPVIAWAINNLGDATLTIAVIAIIQIFFWAIHLYTHPNIDPFEIKHSAST